MDARRRPPADTRPLSCAEMTAGDLDDMAALLGGADVMRYYPRPKTRDEALSWIGWNRDLYQREGFGLWMIRLRATGEFVGDCGLTVQEVEGRSRSRSVTTFGLICRAEVMPRKRRLPAAITHGKCWA